MAVENRGDWGLVGPSGNGAEADRAMRGRVNLSGPGSAEGREGDNAVQARGDEAEGSGGGWNPTDPHLHGYRGPDDCYDEGEGW